MKPLKKEAKIIIGVSATIFLLVIIALVVVLAVMESKKGATLFFREYSYVETDSNGTSVTVRDNLFIAGVDGGMVLINENAIVSKKYVSLKLVDSKNKLFEFTTTENEYGIIDKDGKEITKVKSNGNFINDMASIKSFDFTYEKVKNNIVVSLKDTKTQSYKEVLLYSSSVNSLPSGEPILKPNALAGTFIFSSIGVNNKNYFLTSIYNQSVMLDISTIVSSGESYVTCNEEGQYKTYSLPRLEEIVNLQGEKPDNILFYESNGELLSYAVVSVEASNYTTSIFMGRNKTQVQSTLRPVGILESSNNATLILLEDSSVIFAKGTFRQSGKYKRIGEFIKVADSLYTKELISVSVRSTDDNDKLITTNDGTNYYYLSKNLYTYKDKALSLVLSNCETTFGNEIFSQKLETEIGATIYDYDVFFTSGDTAYDKNLKALTPKGANIRVMNKNLIEIGNTYYDYAGKKKIENVDAVYPIYNHKNEKTGNYVFEKSDGYYSYDDRLASKDYLKNNGLNIFNDKLSGMTGVMAYELADGAIIFNTDLGIVCGETFVDTTKYNKMAFLGQGMLALESTNTIDIYKITKKAMTFSNSISANGIKIQDRKKDVGIIFTDNSQKYGFIGTNGKQVLDKIYNSISFVSNNLLVERNGVSAIYDMNGAPITAFKYLASIGFKELGSHTILMTTKLTYEIVNTKGEVVVSGSVMDVYDVNNLTTHHSGEYVKSKAYDYYFIFNDGVYRVIKEAK